MAQISKQQAKVQGTTLTYGAAAAGDKVAPDDDAALHVLNGSGSTITVTIATPGNDKYGQARPDIAVPVAAGAHAVIGPFPDDLADPTDGLVAISWSSTTTVTRAYVGH